MRGRRRRDGRWVDIYGERPRHRHPRRDLERIFERFYRVDRARRRETGGTGLGLAIVRHVASNHGGEVPVESTEGEGSTFTLPCRARRGERPRPIGDGPGLTPLPTDVGG